MQGERAVADGLRTLRHQKTMPAPEQHGEERYEFLVEEDMRNSQIANIRRCPWRRYGRRVDIGCRDHGEGLDVHHQNPDHRAKPRRISSVAMRFKCRLTGANAERGRVDWQT